MHDVRPVRPVRILIVDEEEALADVVRRTLLLEGWEPAIAPSGAAALAAVVETRPDIILLDMMLPDMRGTEVATRLRADGVQTPIVFLTGRTDHEDRMSGYQAGADDYLTKPFGLDELVRALQPIVRRLGLGEHSHRVGDLVIDAQTSEVWQGDEQLFLSPAEVQLLLASAA